VLEEEISIFTTSWNVAVSSPPRMDVLREWLGEAGKHHIYIIGFQECGKKRANW
jgi:hypothetical protein